MSTQKSKEQIYEEAGLGVVDLEPGADPAVIVVDLQRAFTDPASDLGSDLSETVEATAELVDAAHRNEVPVYYTRVVWRDDLKDGAVFAAKGEAGADSVKEGSDFLEIDPRLDVAEQDHIVEKDQPSGFFETELSSMLTYEHIDTTIVTGATTSGCVRATVVDACSHGYIPIVPIECVGDRAEEPHEANLFDMGQKYAELWNLDDVVDYFEDL